MAETKKMGSGDLPRVAQHRDNRGEWRDKTVTSWHKPIFIVLIILGVVGLGVAGAGLARFGVHQGWWSTGALSNLSQIDSIITMAAGGGGGILFLIIGIVGLVKAHKKKILEGEPLETDLKEIAFGFRSLKGFTMKQKDGYIIADNNSYARDSAFRVAKAELDSFFKAKKKSDVRQLSSSDERSISSYIKLAAQEYKIHLMPKPEYMEEVVSRLITKMEKDAKLKQYVAQYKVLLGEKSEEGSVEVPVIHGRGGYYPRIVLYAESKEAGQAILNAIYKLFPDSDDLGDDKVPRDNTHVNALIYYAHGSADIKNLAADCDFTLFKETIPGEYALQISN